MTIAMLICLVYQLGACPCGCLEHNAWAEMLGLSSHDHHGVPATSTTSVSSGEDHDCKGYPRPLYVSNENDWGRWIACLSSPPTLAADSYASIDCDDRVQLREHRGPPVYLTARTHPASLQVFLL